MMGVNVTDPEGGDGVCDDRSIHLLVTFVMMCVVWMILVRMRTSCVRDGDKMEVGGWVKYYLIMMSMCVGFLAIVSSIFVVNDKYAWCHHINRVAWVAYVGVGCVVFVGWVSGIGFEMVVRRRGCVGGIWMLFVVWVSVTCWMLGCIGTIFWLKGVWWELVVIGVVPLIGFFVGRSMMVGCGEIVSSSSVLGSSTYIRADVVKRHVLLGIMILCWVPSFGFLCGMIATMLVGDLAVESIVNSVRFTLGFLVWCVCLHSVVISIGVICGRKNRMSGRGESLEEHLIEMGSDLNV